MAIDKKLIHFKNKENFENEVANKNILDHSIVFIQDSKEISTHGTEYKFCNWSVLENPWENISNGVYAVSSDGKPVEVANADASCIGVAFISANQKIMIAKNDATDGTNITLHWGKNLQEQDVPNLENLANAEAKVDYNGKDNTAAIIAGYAALGKDMNSRDMCKVLETFNEGGYTDWYVPAAGQLCELYYNRTALNEALTATNSTKFNTSNPYWSSSEGSASTVWRVLFTNGLVYASSKDIYSYVRFVRDL